MKTTKTVKNTKPNQAKSDPPILYTDQATIHTTDVGVIIDFGQSVGDSNESEETVVARVGMSRQHAVNILKALYENLNQLDLQNLKKHH